MSYEDEMERLDREYERMQKDKEKREKLEQKKVRNAAMKAEMEEKQKFSGQRNRDDNDESSFCKIVGCYIL